VIRDSMLPDSRAHELPIESASGAPYGWVVDVMSQHVVTVPAGADLVEAADLLVSTAVKSLPVVENGRVVGVISRRDIIHVLARRDELIEAQVDELCRVSNEDWVAEVKDGVVTFEGPSTEAEHQLAQVLVCTVPGVVGGS
jgi:predicted transcriptional regulator